MTNSKRKKLKKNVRVKSLDPQYMPKVRRELLDYDKDFLNNLKKNHPEDYLYLAQFTDEWVGANIQKTGTKKRKDGTTIYNSGRVKAGHLHSTNELAKDVFDRNNKRNNDVLGVAKINGLASDVITELNKNDGWYVTQAGLTEEAIISQMDEKNSDDCLLTYEEYLKVKNQLTPEMLLFYLSIYEND